MIAKSRMWFPRILHLFTSNRRFAFSVDNWQNALRKQYIKRDPLANPMGLEAHDSNRPVKHEDPAPSANELGINSSVENDEGNAEHAPSVSQESPDSVEPVSHEIAASVQPDDTRSRHSSVAGTRETSKGRESEVGDDVELGKPVDWFDLPLLVKLETIHTLAEWQFQNPNRLRTIMKSDDDTASWVS